MYDSAFYQNNCIYLYNYMMQIFIIKYQDINYQE